MKTPHPEAMLHADLTETIHLAYKPKDISPAELDLARIAAAAVIGHLECTHGMGALAFLAKREVEGPGGRIAESIRQTRYGLSFQGTPSAFEELAERYGGDVLDLHEGMARAFYVSAWMNSEQEAGRTHPGEDLEKIAPQTSEEARYAAAKMLGHLEVANQAPLPVLMFNAKKADIEEEAERQKDLARIRGLPPPASDKEEAPAFDAHNFGWYLGMQSLGHGVSWFDDHARFPLKVPHSEFNLDDHHPPLAPKQSDVARAKRHLADVQAVSPGIGSH